MRIGVVVSSVWLRTVLGICGVCAAGAATLVGPQVMEWWVWLMLGAGLATVVFSLLLTVFVLWSRYDRRSRKFKKLLVAVAAAGVTVGVLVFLTLIFWDTGNAVPIMVIFLIAVVVGHALTRNRPVSS